MGRNCGLGPRADKDFLQHKRPEAGKADAPRSRTVTPGYRAVRRRRDDVHAGYLPVHRLPLTESLGPIALPVAEHPIQPDLHARYTKPLGSALRDSAEPSESRCDLGRRYDRL